MQEPAGQEAPERLINRFQEENREVLSPPVVVKEAKKAEDQSELLKITEYLSARLAVEENEPQLSAPKGKEQAVKKLKPEMSKLHNAKDIIQLSRLLRKRKIKR